MGMMKDMGRQRDYVSYLLRMWQDSGEEGAPPLQEVLWRASLQSPRSGEMLGFASLEDLFDFLLGLASSLH